MTSVRKRKMSRSSVPKNTRRHKDRQRKINIHSNPIVAANWDPNLTVKQNYKRMGLQMKLGSSPGGSEKDVPTLTELQQKQEQKNSTNVKEIEQTDDPDKIPEGEAKIIRDPESGEVKQVIYGRMKHNDHEENQESKSEVLKQLEEYAETRAPEPKERKPSQRESEWLQQMYEKYGDDYDSMMWDKKLNAYQQTAAQLKKKVLHWKRANQI